MAIAESAFKSTTTCTPVGLNPASVSEMARCPPPPNTCLRRFPSTSQMLMALVNCTLRTHMFPEPVFRDASYATLAYAEATCPIKTAVIPSVLLPPTATPLATSFSETMTAPAKRQANPRSCGPLNLSTSPRSFRKVAVKKIFVCARTQYVAAPRLDKA
eukprot:scaffold1435_cov267-Pinguiococcus_pyrenoidosus.AAC.9